MSEEDFIELRELLTSAILCLRASNVLSEDTLLLCAADLERAARKRGLWFNPNKDSTPPE